MEKEMNNLVIISDRDKIMVYISNIIYKMAPSIYNRSGCIIIQVRESLKDFADFVIKRMRWAGIYVDSQTRKSIKQSDGWTLKDAWEIKLKKIPALETAREEDEFELG
jgi:hypothetical protein